MRQLGLVTALLSSCLLFAGQMAFADEAKPDVPIPITDVAQGKTPAIADLSGTLHVAFEKDAAIYYSASSDSGKSWSDSKKISGLCLAANHPFVACAADKSINVVWQGNLNGDKIPGIYFVRSTDGGKTFSVPFDISHTPTTSSEPQVAVGKDNSIHVVWIDALPAPGLPDVFYTVSTNGGKTWSKPTNLSNTPGGYSRDPAIAVGNDSRIHVAWSDTSSGEESPDIFYVTKIEENPWTLPVDLSADPGYSAHPSISCGPDGKVYVVWTDNSKKTAGDIFCLIEETKGRFGKKMNVSATRGVSSQPMITVDSSEHFAVVWLDTSATLKVPDIWARTGYKNQLQKKLQLCKTDGESIHPSVSISNHKAFTVWEEVDGGSSTIKGCYLLVK